MEEHPSLEVAIKQVEDLLMQIRTYSKEHNLLNEQFYLEFEDRLNKFSTLDPNY